MNIIGGLVTKPSSHFATRRTRALLTNSARPKERDLLAPHVGLELSFHSLAIGSDAHRPPVT